MTTEIQHVLQVTDCHLYAPVALGSSGQSASSRRLDTAESLAAVLAEACAERRPDAVLATGDIAQQPRAATYRRFLDIVRSQFDGPLLCVPGNHDYDAVFRQLLPCADLDLGRWHVLGVDTHVDDEVGGHMTERRLAELSNRLSAVPAGQPVLCVGHHCPVALCAWLDEHRIAGSDAFVALLERFRVKAYAFGHIHQEVDEPGVTRLLGTPSTCYQFGRGETFSIEDLPPGYRWLRLGADGSLATEARHVGTG